MKIKVKDIIPNRYRRIDQYNINREKVDHIKLSINKTTFWDNILLRPVEDGKYELAYGHHRWIALNELGIEEIDVPVRELDDATMLQIMADENLSEWHTSPAVIGETVLATKEFLDAELAKYDSLKYCDENIRVLFSGVKGDFLKAKDKGVGRTTIQKFLNGGKEDGLWKKWMVQDALSVMKDNTISKEAIGMLPSMSQAKVFKREVKKYKIPKEEQKGLAKDIAGREKSGSVVEGYIREHAEITERVKKPFKPKGRPDIEKVVDEAIRNIGELERNLSRLRGNLKYIWSDEYTNLLEGNLGETFERHLGYLAKLIGELEKEQEEVKENKRPMKKVGKDV